MNLIFKQICTYIENVLKTFEIEEKVIISISKQPIVDYQINTLVKHRKNKNFEQISSAVIHKLKEIKYIKKCEISSNYFVNIYIDSFEICKLVSNDSIEFKSEQIEKIIIDYGGPNIGKPLHVGHIRTLNLGRSLYNIHTLAGNEILSDIHLGDWGMPVAQIIAFINEESKQVDNISAQDLQEIYPIASKKYLENNDFKQLAQQINKELNNNNLKFVDMWEKIKNISVNNLFEIFEVLKHKFDFWYGESDVNNLIEPMLEKLKTEEKIILDDGAYISAENSEPKILITKSDGSYLYITTDLATVLFRQEQIGYTKALYIVDNRQSLHFNQLFRSIKYFQFNEYEHIHVAYGTVNDAFGNPFKTRDGKTKPLLDLYNEILSHIKNINTDLDEVNLSILTNSVLTFSDLLSNRKTDYKFDLNKFTNISGKTGLYVQYSQVRARKLKNNFTDVKGVLSRNISECEHSLLKQLVNFGYYFEQSKELNEPHHLANYLYDISNLFNIFYENEKLIEIKDSKKLSHKIYIIDFFLKTCHQVMFCLGIEPAEEM